MKTVDTVFVCGNGKVTVIPIKYKKESDLPMKFQKMIKKMGPKSASLVRAIIKKAE